MREILVMMPAYAHPSTRTYRLSGWRWEGRTASGDGSVQAIFLGGKSHGSVGIWQPAFFWQEIILVKGKRIKIKEQKKSTREEATKFEKFK